MTHPIYRVRSFEIVSDYVLRIGFDDDSEQTIDFRPVLAGELYGPLRVLKLFDQVSIDPEVHTLILAEWGGLRSSDPARLAHAQRCS